MDFERQVWYGMDFGPHVLYGMDFGQQVGMVWTFDDRYGMVWTLNDRYGMVRRYLIWDLHSSNFYTLSSCYPVHAISKTVP